MTGDSFGGGGVGGGVSVDVVFKTFAQEEQLVNFPPRLRDGGQEGGDFGWGVGFAYF